MLKEKRKHQTQPTTGRLPEDRLAHRTEDDRKPRDGSSWPHTCAHMHLLIVGTCRVNIFPVDDESLLSGSLDIVADRHSPPSILDVAAPRQRQGRSNIRGYFDGAGRVHLEVVQNIPLENAALRLAARIVVVVAAAVGSPVDHDVRDDRNHDDNDDEN